MLPRYTKIHKIKDVLRHKNNKWLWKRYEPHCPSPTCTGGHRNKLHRISGKPNWLGQQVRDKIKEKEISCKCSCCGLVWFQKDSEKLGFDARPVGYYDDFAHPLGFVPLRKRFQTREQNTTSYWYNVRRKGIRPPRWGGVD
jgi:hypothetical protein